MKQPEIPWIAEAKSHIGIHEKRNTDVLNTFWADVASPGNYKAIFKDKPNIAWCSAFTGSCLKRGGVDIKLKSPFVIENAQYWTHGMIKLAKPEYGCIVVFKWKNGTGHVGFVVGRNRSGNIIVLGGNQNNEVSEKAFSTADVVGYYWPEGTPYIPEDSRPLPVIDMAWEHVRT